MDVGQYTSLYQFFSFFQNIVSRSSLSRRVVIVGYISLLWLGLIVTLSAIMLILTAYRGN